MAWPVDWERGYVHGAIAEATGVVLSADDPLPDMLIAKAQELGLQPPDLKRWIYEELARSDTRYALITAALAGWVERSRAETES